MKQKGSILKLFSSKSHYSVKNFKMWCLYEVWQYFTLQRKLTLNPNVCAFLEPAFM